LSGLSPSQLLFERARSQRWAGDLSAAAETYRTALRLLPDDHPARWNLAQVLLALGAYEEAWPLFGSRFEADPSIYRPRLSLPEWQGEPMVGGRLLVVFEQGLGDQIQFARFVPVLRDMGVHVTLSCAKPLGPLFEQFGVDLLYGDGKVRPPRVDRWAMICDLPRRMGITLGNLPNAPYLSARPRPAEGRIGVAWKGSPAHRNDANRSLDPAARDMLLALPGAMSLHPEDTGAVDFEETAGLIASLDRVVTVDTSIAHLAGAMGKPTTILLPARETDWRWMVGRSDSPWYPSARLVRQALDEPWSAVVSRLIHENIEDDA
jgi:tetratricopeptide (TPR) repeat protein